MQYLLCCHFQKRAYIAFDIHLVAAKRNWVIINAMRCNAQRIGIAINFEQQHFLLVQFQAIIPNGATIRNAPI